MAKASQAAEPSMEEILASIRRIISDEVAPAPQPVQAQRVAAPEPEADTVSEDDLDRLFADANGSPAEDELTLDETFEEGGEDSFAEAGELELVEGFPEESDLAFQEPDDFDFESEEPEPVAVAPEPLAEPKKIAPVAARPDMNAPSRIGAASAIMSNEAGSHVSAAFASLANTVFSGQQRTIEDLVQEMLRPMLKDWLDENLPAMVERLVRAEIERVSRGTR